MGKMAIGWWMGYRWRSLLRYSVGLSTKESRRRSVMKALSWRVSGSLATTIIVFLFTGSVTTSIGVGVSEAIAKSVWYYVHERLWERIPWGRMSHPLAALPIKKELAAQDLETIRRRLHDLGYL